MNEVIKSPEFIDWQERQDRNIADRVDAAILKMEKGNLGDHKPIDALVNEARIHVHSGIRLYYMQHRKHLILLLVGGNKSSQKKDIKKAKEIARRIIEAENDEEI